MVTTTAIPLIIHGKDILLSNNDRKHPITSKSAPHLKSFQGATSDLAVQAVESCASAFPSWSQTPPEERRRLLLNLARLLREKSSTIQTLIKDEIHCTPLWSQLNVEIAAGIVEETASVITDAISGTIPSSQGNTYALVMKKPLGVVLGIAPWNAPVILGLRSVISVIAAGNTAILKGSELSPQTHYFLAALFREAGFPPGVVNFVLHRPQDAAEIYECMIQHPAVKKCNFTGSTQVGRVIASKAAMALKPVLLELGGKNPVVVLEDADLDQAADEIIAAGYLNNGQICMSTDLVYVVQSVAKELTKKILERLHSEDRPHKVISAAGRARLTQLVEDARSKGAVIHQARNPLAEDPLAFPATVIEGVTEEMEFYTIESFGPVFGIIAVDSAEQGLQMLKRSAYGLSSAVFTRDHFKALGMSADIAVGAVHVNGGTVHDEPTLPHGGVGDSGYGRFGGKWGLNEFLQTQTVILNRVRASL
ncbi:putative aldehyde dehydrogenase [Aspergillus neoniger CBS 115656]|uniref:Aldehyde dehydrogenase n=1 Tax=Aspergillus neoniger (strain CBS 115656) TaxID=1448310 RepID=A0A318Z2Z1_ASPNB|nr:aldehyde dehydrogenase [Aspergillus neoniger CBS 115656]PYH38170.1 aldehyde dehydrogenase [Aspergillus neoniger CBS 115656]